MKNKIVKIGYGSVSFAGREAKSKIGENWEKGRKKRRKMMSKNMKLFLLFVVMFVVLAVVVMMSADTVLAGVETINGFCVGSGSGSAGVCSY